jgi:aminoglycoside 3-N-acetyltransferase
VVQALLQTWETLVMPAFTYKTMLTPETGPDHNGIQYGSSTSVNRMAEFFQPGMPVDRLIGAVPEALRCHPLAERSNHPILSFTGVNAAEILHSQTLGEPLAPIRRLWQAGGWVLLLGVDHTVNTSIHFAEFLAGRRQFIRWALTTQGVVECPGFPGCSDGFQALAPDLQNVTRQVQIGRALIQAVPLVELVAAAWRRLAKDPLALLCNRGYCERCLAVKEEVDLTIG